MNDWYVRVQGRVLGPYAMDRLHEMRDSGQLQSFHEVSTDNRNWQLAGHINELFPSAVSLRAAAQADQAAMNGTMAPTRPAGNRSLLPIFLIGGVLGLIGLLVVGVVLAVIFLRGKQDSSSAKPVVAQASAPEEPGRRFRPAPLKRQSDPDSNPIPDADAGKAPRDERAPKTTKPSSNPPPLPAPSAPPRDDEGPPNSGKSEIIDFTSATDPVLRHRMVKHSVGLVIFGLAVTRRDGSKVEIGLSTGTCFAVGPQGILVTNRHVIEELSDAKKTAARRRLEKESGARIIPVVWVFFSRNDKFVAEVRYKSDNYDFAVLKVDRANPYYFAFSKRKTEEIVPDLSVTACGFPGLQRDIVNIASGNDLQMPRGPVESQFPNEAFSPTQEAGKVTAEPYVFVLAKQPLPFPLNRDPKCIQHTAEIFHGNSGGPLLLENGTAVGINTYGFTAKNKEGESKKVNLSITVNQLEDEINDNVPGAVWR